jgi:outer membrane protein
MGNGKIGIGVGMAPDYEGSDDTEATPSLFGRYQWDSGRYVALGGTCEAGKALRLRANLLSDAQNSTWEMGPVLQLRMERDDVDNRRVDRMKKIDSATELGAFVGFRSGPWAASLTFAADVSDEHEGSVTEFAGSYHIPVNDELSLKFGASVSYADEDYMDTYFGVNSKNVGNSGFANYNADDGFKDYGLSATARYTLNQNWGLQGGVTYFRLLNDAKDSPLVDGEGDENQLSASVAVTYSF